MTASQEPSADAFLLIGDAAMAFDRPGWEALDLLATWRALTGLPFVFAIWQARPGIDVAALGARLRRCCAEGLRQVAAIAEREAPRYRMSPARTLDYIARIVHYDLGDEERAALRRFQEYLLKHGLLDAPRPDL